MAQGARRPPRQHRQSRQIYSQDTARSQESSTRGSATTEEELTAREILSVLSSGPSDQLLDVSLKGKSGVEIIRARLPTITNNAELDFQLYALLAIIFRLCMHSWYETITPDKEVNEQLLDIITTCIQRLQQRLTRVDLEALILDDLPSLVLDHVQALGTAERACMPASKHDQERAVFHAIRPHPALDPVPISPPDVASQTEHETLWSQMVIDRILPLIMPANDMQNPGMSVMIREIFAEMILLRGVCGKLSEPWFLWESIHRALIVAFPQTEAVDDHHPVKVQARQRAPQPWSTLTTIKTIWFTATAVLLSIWSLIMVALSFDRRSVSSQSMLDMLSSREGLLATAKPAIDGRFSKRPILEAKIWTCLTHLTSLNNRMPWLVGGLSLLQWLLLNGPGKVGGLDNTLDRWAKLQLKQMLLNTSALPSILKAARESLFPGGAFAAARPIPTTDEIVVIKNDCGKAILQSIPFYVRHIYFATTDEAVMLKDIDLALDALGDAYINKALIISLVELVIARVCPELV